MYKNSFKRSDFAMQIEGLQNFDQYLAKKGYPIQVFGYEEFLDIVQEIDSQLPEEEEGQGEEQQEQPKPEPKVEVKTQPKLIQKPIPIKEPVLAVKAQPSVVVTSPTPVTGGNAALEAIKAKMKSKFGK